MSNTIILLFPPIQSPENNNAPCFSHKTYKILKEKGIFNKIHVIISGPRNNKEMYSCDFYDLGNLEFTSDHPFLYNNRIVAFEELTQIDTNIKNIKKISNDEIDTVYNVIGYPIQNDHRNMFRINNNLVMIGGKYNQHVSEENFEKRMKILEKLCETEEGAKIAAEKYSFGNSICKT
jgi:hypothetical protein